MKFPAPPAALLTVRTLAETGIPSPGSLSLCHCPHFYICLLVPAKKRRKMTFIEKEQVVKSLGGRLSF